ncbi:unnamed protein product [Peronospora belbahrii]|uniref:Calponin-homology (CH) domain-containing protein n=1 Tax=Peronospora belbahrii TaxID=622444 RepID=A0ABN8CWR1_9STRA|nr:unnamed protein product [Peronospora belbahrii]
MQKIFAPKKSFYASREYSSTKKPFAGSWWKQRQETYDENWMAKQAEGFTRWMNYVLLESTALRLSDCDEQDGTQESLVGTKRKFDYTSLRMLAQKRLELSWVQFAVKLYRSSSMSDVLFNLQDEIGNQRLRLRADRPVYADLSLQEDLISLLNNYHPVWLCLGLYAVLGKEVMSQEKCSLRTIFRCTCTKATITDVKDSSLDRKMPRVLRRIVLKHLVKDSHVAQNYGLVKNLMAPLDGSTADRYDGGNGFKNTKKNINGREYFDSLTQALMLKFFMLVMFLDRAVQHRGDKFAHFPCLFRIARSTKSTIPIRVQDSINKKERNSDEDDELSVKKSKVLVTEFCRLFLANEGRIDKHLNQLGYSLKHEQTALDEVDLEITNVETDLRDGVRLAKLMEALTAPASSSTIQIPEITSKPKSLSTFLRVPAQSRLQKVHNVEICLHFLQDKCGASALDNLKSSSETDKKRKPAGRVRMSSSGFAGLRTKVDEKMVENLAKDIVNGHREKTLALLWKLISQFQLQSLVDAQAMRCEIENVVKRMSFRSKDFFDFQQKNVPLIYTDEHECYGLLLVWCRAVCANYCVGVNNFSGSFADGKALCYLLHYYHPMLLSNSDVLPTTSDISDADDQQQISEKTLLSNEQRHFAIINDRIKQLGEVPVIMPRQYNTKNPPEEKIVVTFVCYLQSRLMDSCSEIHAAYRLKRWWKSPLIRLRLLRKKNTSARIIQRFWYTSSQKRLAIRQCRKLLRAAHYVKSTLLTWVTRKHFLQLRKAVGTIQTTFRTRRQLRMNGDLLDAAQIIQCCWRKYLKRRHQKSKLKAQQALHHEVANHVLAKVSCGVIEQHWLQHLSREGARLVRQQIIADRHAAVSRVQVAWRRGRLRVAARMHRAQAWRREHQAAQVIQLAWGSFQRHLEESKRILSFRRFEQLMKTEELQKRQMKLKCKVEMRAANCIQRGFRTFMFRKREVAATKLASAFRGATLRLHFRLEKRAAVVLQRNVRVWRRRRQLCALTHFYGVLKIYQRNRANETQQRVSQEIQFKVETKAAYHIQNVYRSFRSQKRTFAATRIQSVVLAWLTRKWYSSLQQSACLLQKNIRTWRRQKQLRVLLAFGGLLLRYRRMQQDEKERQERIRQDRLRRLQKCVKHRAARHIQSVYRSYAYRKRMLAATLIHAVFRGFKEQQRYAKKRTSVVVMQHSIRSWLVVRKFQRAMYHHRASVSIQKSNGGT